MTPRWWWAAVALASAGCTCVTLAPGTSFLCESGSCPEGFVCSADGYCDAVGADGGTGGGAGGAGGGLGGAGGAGGGLSTLLPCSHAWCWEHPTPWGAAAVNSVVTTGANDAWVVGDNGFVFHWNGARWLQGTTSNRYDLFDVWVSPEGEVWAVGRAGTVMHLESGRFVDRGRPFADSLLAITGSSGSDFWVAGTNSRIARYQAGVWSDVPSSPLATNYSDLSLVDPTRALVVGNAMQQWSGGTLTPVAAPATGLHSVWVNPGGEAWVGGLGGVLFKSSGAVPDAGSDWTPVDSGTVQAINSVWGAASGEVYYGGVDGVFLASPAFSGKVSTVSNISAVNGTDPSNIWASSFGGEVLRRAISGGPFNDARQLVAVTSQQLISPSLNADGTAFAVGDNHLVMRRAGDGQWATVPVEGNQLGGHFWEVWSDAVDHAVAVGDDPVRLRVFDPVTGAFRAPAAFTPLENLYAVWGSGNEVFAGGANNYLIHFDGAAWSQVVGLPRSITIEGIWGTAPDNFWVVGSNLTVLHWNGLQWDVEAENGGSLYGVGGKWPNGVFAVGPGGVILHRDPADGGWAAETSGVTYSFENVAEADGVVMAVASEGELMQRQDDAGWKRWGTTLKDGVPLWGISGAPGRGFLAVGNTATILRWVP